MSWPGDNYHFKRGWAEPPPHGGERSQGSGGNRPLGFVSSITDNAHTLSDRLAQRARAWDRAADRELALGHHAVAERLAHLAADLRGAP